MRIFSIIFVLTLLWTNAAQAAEPAPNEVFAAWLVKNCPASMTQLPEPQKACDCLLKELRARKQPVLIQQDVTDFYAQANPVCVAPIVQRQSMERCYQEMAPKLTERFGLSKPQFTPFCECMTAEAIKILQAPAAAAQRSREETVRHAEMQINRCVAEARTTPGEN